MSTAAHSTRNAELPLISCKHPLIVKQVTLDAYVTPLTAKASPGLSMQR